MKASEFIKGPALVVLSGFQLVPNLLILLAFLIKLLRWTIFLLLSLLSRLPPTLEMPIPCVTEYPSLVRFPNPGRCQGIL